MPNGGEGALDRIGGAKMRPMLGRHQAFRLPFFCFAIRSEEPVFFVCVGAQLSEKVWKSLENGSEVKKTPVFSGFSTKSRSASHGTAFFSSGSTELPRP
jgi:hypothetical protein